MQSHIFLFLSIHYLILIIVWNYVYWLSTWALSRTICLSFAFGLLIIHFVLAAGSFLSLMNRAISTANFTRLPNSMTNLLSDRGKLGLTNSLWWTWYKRLYRLLRGGELPDGSSLMPVRLLLRLLSWPIYLRSVIIKRQCCLKSFFVEIWNLVLCLHTCLIRLQRSVFFAVLISLISLLLISYRHKLLLTLEILSLKQLWMLQLHLIC